MDYLREVILVGIVTVLVGKLIIGIFQQRDYDKRMDEEFKRFGITRDRN